MEIVLAASLLLSIIFLGSLVVVAYKKNNLKAANIIAVIFSLFVIVYKNLGINNFFYDSYFFIYILLALGSSFIIGGFISSMYFSKYYGEIIIKCGIAFFILLALLSIIYSDMFMNQRVGVENFMTILTNFAHIIFWTIYFNILSRTNISLVSKNDPKNW